MIALAVLGVSWAIHVGAVIKRPAVEPVARFAVAEPTESIGRLRETGVHDLPAPAGMPASHSSTLVTAKGADGADRLVAFWFAGARESAADVRIYASRFDASGAPGREWSEPVAVVDRDMLGKALGFGVRRIGNPVAWADGRGRVHLFVVATGLGGWAASRIVHLVSDDGARRFAADRALALSPLFNTSMLVRGAPVPMADGGALLPIYFEIGAKYPLVLSLSPDGSPTDLVRVADGLDFAQPSIAPLGPDAGVALLRDVGNGRRLRLVHTRDGGRTWSKLETSDQPNADASVVALRLPDGSLVAASNPLEKGRHALALLRSFDGVHWQRWRQVEEGRVGDEFSYPSLHLMGGTLHLSYTWQRRHIRHRSFAMEPAS
ncbi:MAG: exo-alpha-sialidase [Lautropia sp.]